MRLQVEDIRKEDLIHKKWHFRKSKPQNYPEGILVTGANSFIGTHIVSFLQEASTGPVHLLLRAPSLQEAVLKMQQAFSNWELGDFLPEKFNLHLGDVTGNMMGIPQAEYQQLKKQVGIVIHLAMTPLYHLPYHHFKRVWVPELEKMIGFCGDTEFPKKLHYASSFNANFFQTDDDFKSLNSNAWQSGYAGFKWVANKSILNAFSQNLQGCIYDIPLVLGSENNGICPKHYSIWMILDIFIKTGHFFKFDFRIIPVDILALLVVSNAINQSKSEECSFIRPALTEPVTDKIFSKMVASILGLKESCPEKMRESCQNKLKFDFMVPGNFYELIDKVNHLPQIFPPWFDMKDLPNMPVVFMNNLNRALARQKEVFSVE